MKKVIITLIIFHFSFLFANAQWVQQTSGTTDQLLKVKFINRYTGWTCGYNGRMIKTTNGGINWVIQNTGVPSKSLRSLNIVNSDILYSAGLFETLIKTTDGGNNWIILKDGIIGNSGSYWGSFFLNENTGWICGTGQKILKTTNGGLNFDSAYVPTGYLYDLYFRNSLEGLACGQSASMYKTTNGGLNWNFITVPTGGALSDFNNFSFINYNTGFIIGAGTKRLYKTTNFGTNWDSASTADGYEVAYTVFFANEFTGWIGGSSGYMRKTTNGGYNWYHENITQFGNGFFGGIYFYNDTIGWAVGAPGKILYTETGGQINQISNNKEQIANEFILYQNYPNPFNPVTSIKYKVSSKKQVNLVVYNILGKEIATLVNEKKSPGIYEVVFGGNGFPSGIYFYRIQAGEFVQVKKMVLLK